MKTLFIALLLAGIVPASGRAQSSVSADSVPTGCQLSFNWGNAYTYDGPPYHYDWAYDTLTAFVEHCPTHWEAPKAFQILSDDVQHGGNGAAPAALFSFQKWLISALAWNPGNSDYFCADVYAIMGTVTTGLPDTTWQQRNTETNRGLSVLYWLIHNSPCSDAGDTELYNNSRGGQIGTWITTQDTSKVPLDTTIYSMHDLGLDSVLKYAALLGVHEPGMENILSNATAYPNPTGTGTELSFSTNKEAYVRIKLYDVLGKGVGATAFEDVLEPGNHEVPISLHGLPSGTYYARIVTAYGEVHTVKLVKQ